MVSPKSQPRFHHHKHEQKKKRKLRLQRLQRLVSNPRSELGFKTCKSTDEITKTSGEFSASVSMHEQERKSWNPDIRRHKRWNRNRFLLAAPAVRNCAYALCPFSVFL